MTCSSRFTGAVFAAPNILLILRRLSNSGSFFGISSTINPIYRWQGSGANDGALTPTLAVDNNVSSFSDGTTTQNDPHAGNIYVAWETNDAAPKGVTSYNPNLIKVMSSSDNGQNFTYQAYLSSGHGVGNTFDLPRIAISQGIDGAQADARAMTPKIARLNW